MKNDATLAEAFYKELTELLQKHAGTKNEGLPIFAIVGIMECTKADMLRRATMATEQMAANDFAARMAQNATKAPDKN